MDANRHLPALFVSAVVAFGVSMVWFWLTWRYDLDLADEGFYWYGVQRVLAGDVPLLDFMAYDIGRYYWGAAVADWIGEDGLFASRLSAMSYQVLGTLLGVYLCLIALEGRGALRWAFAILVAAILTLWVTMYYKVYDHATSILIVGICVALLRSSDRRVWLLMGIALGLAAVMGRNHGVYGAVAVLLVILHLLLTRRVAPAQLRPLIAHFAVGVLVGFTPNLVLMIRVDGFLGAFWDSILEIFDYGGTNIALPVPWPWDVDLNARPLWRTLSHLGTGIGFLVVLLFPLFAFVVLAFRGLRSTRNADVVLTAAMLAGVPYLHYAFSRADLHHLALGIMPTLIGLLAIGASAGGRRPLLVGALILAATLVTVPKGILLHRVVGVPYVATEIDGERIMLESVFARRLSILMPPVAEAVAQGQRFLALPNMPGLHAIFRERMSGWEIYPLFAVGEAFERTEIARISASPPDLLILSDHALDEDPALRFSSTHPLTYGWIIQEYAPNGRVALGPLKSYSRVPSAQSPPPDAGDAPAP